MDKIKSAGAAENSASTAKTLVFPKIRIVDVRAESERCGGDGGHIPGSEHVPSDDFAPGKKRFDELVASVADDVREREAAEEKVAKAKDGKVPQKRPPAQVIVFHCAFSQQRGPAAARLFAREVAKKACSDGSDLGVQQARRLQVKILEGGYVNWERSMSDMIAYD